MGKNYGYEANGNQTTRTIGSDVYTLIYDAENRIVEVKKNSASIATFTYDGDGARVMSTIGGVTSIEHILAFLITGTSLPSMLVQG